MNNLPAIFPAQYCARHQKQFGFECIKLARICSYFLFVIRHFGRMLFSCQITKNASCLKTADKLQREGGQCIRERDGEGEAKEYRVRQRVRAKERERKSGGKGEKFDAKYV